MRFAPSSLTRVSGCSRACSIGVGWPSAGAGVADIAALASRLRLAAAWDAASWRELDRGPVEPDLEPGRSSAAGFASRFAAAGPRTPASWRPTLALRLTSLRSWSQLTPWAGDQK